MLFFSVGLNKASAGVLQPVEVFTLPEKCAGEEKGVGQRERGGCKFNSWGGGQ